MTTENSNPVTTTETQAAAPAEPTLGRNEPCPCGSGKKYKRCHGVDAAPKYTAPAQPAPGAGMPSIPGFDPNAVDPAMMNQMAQALQRLPRPQLQKLQSLMQRAMAGKDVAAEAAQLEKMLPPEFASMAQQMMMSGAMGGGAAAPVEMPKTDDDAKKIIAEAVAAGTMKAEEAKALLGDEADAILAKHGKKGISKLWSKVTGK